MHRRFTTVTAHRGRISATSVAAQLSSIFVSNGRFCSNDGKTNLTPVKSKRQREAEATSASALTQDDSSSSSTFLDRQAEPTRRPDALAFSNPLSMESTQPADVDPRFAEAVADLGALRPTGQWSVKDTVDDAAKTVSFSRIDELDAAAADVVADADRALISVDEENAYKNKLMFVHKFHRTPKHLTWKQLAQEIDTLDCEIDLDNARPEEVYQMRFYFVHKKSGRRRLIWHADNDVSCSEGLQDLLAAVGTCLNRADVHRTIRFDSGKGVTRDFNIRKGARYTSEVMLAFRPPVGYNLYERKDAQDAWEAEMDEQGLSQWGFHPRMMDPEYRDTDDPRGTYHLHLSAHTLGFVVLRALDRLLARPLKDFYRPSQVARTMHVSTSEDTGVYQAVMGWAGFEERLYPHYTPAEAVQDHWFGADSPVGLIPLYNKIREMTNLRPQNPEFQSWLHVRRRDTAIAVRSVRAKLLGVGSSRLFAPMSYDATVNRLLPKRQQRHIKANVSIGAVLGMPDQTKHIDEVRKIAGTYRLSATTEDGEKKNDSDDDNGDDKKKEKTTTTKK